MTIRQVLRKYGKEFTKELRKQIKSKDLIASSDSLNSITYNTVGLKLNIEMDKAIAIQNDGINSKTIPSSTIILQWMKDRNIRPIEGSTRKAGLKKGRSKFAKGGQGSRNMKASAFAIARAIGRNGTIKRFGHKGSDVLDHLSVDSKIGQRFAAELMDAFELEIDEMFELKI